MQSKNKQPANRNQNDEQIQAVANNMAQQNNNSSSIIEDVYNNIEQENNQEIANIPSKVEQLKAQMEADANSPKAMQLKAQMESDYNSPRAMQLRAQMESDSNSPRAMQLKAQMEADANSPRAMQLKAQMKAETTIQKKAEEEELQAKQENIIQKQSPETDNETTVPTPPPPITTEEFAAMDYKEQKENLTPIVGIDKARSLLYDKRLFASIDDKDSISYTDIKGTEHVLVVGTSGSTLKLGSVGMDKAGAHIIDDFDIVKDIDEEKPKYKTVGYGYIGEINSDYYNGIITNGIMRTDNKPDQKDYDLVQVYCADAKLEVVLKNDWIRWGFDPAKFSFSTTPVVSSRTEAFQVKFIVKVQ